MRADGAMGESAERDLSIAPRQVALLSIILLPAVGAFTLLPFVLRWGMVALARSETLLLNPLLLLALLLGLAPLHELLHAAGYLLCGVRREALEFDVHLSTASVLIRCADPVRAEVYRFASVLPFLVLGLLPAAISWTMHSAWLALAATFSIASCTGDLLLLWSVRGVPADALVQDHPVRVGCRVLAS